MRILIDLQGCQSGSRFGGIGRYSMALAKAMLRLQSGHEICLLLNSRLPNENALRAEFADLMPQQNILTFAVPAYVAAENDLPAHTRMAELIREKRIAEINPDVLHIASLFEGAGEDVVTSVGLLFPAEQTAVTLYDLIPYLEQESYLTTAMLADHYLRKFEGLQRAGMLVAISEFSRTEVLAHTDIPGQRIANISSAVDDQFAPCEIAADKKLTLLEKSGIEKPFLMFTGSFDIRKNHARLVKAFALLDSALRDQYQLLIVGKGEDKQIASLKSIAQQHGLHEKDLVFVGHVTDEDLVALYNLCTLFVFPTLREGFGLPALEAMSCGVPTIGSNRTSVPEVIGRADALFDPEDVDDIAAKMTSVLSNAAFRAELKRHGLKQAKNFSWSLSAKRALAFFERRVARLRTPPSPAVRSSPAPIQRLENAAQYDNFLAALSTLNLGKLDDDFLKDAAHVIANNEWLTRIESGEFQVEMPMGWVTSWNSKCGTATHSQRIIDALPARPTIFAPFAHELIAVDATNVIRCWEGGEGADLVELQQALASVPIDVVVIQYEHGVFGLLALARLISQQKKLNRHVFVLLHSSGELATLAVETGQLEIRRALKYCDGIFVHSMHDVKNLDAFKVRKNVNFLPHPKLQTQFEALAAGDSITMNANYLLRKMASAIADGGP